MDRNDRSWLRLLVILAVCGVGISVLGQTGNESPVTIRPGVGGMARFANGASGSPSISFVTNPFDGFFWSSTGHVDYTSNGNPAIDFGPSITLTSTGTLGWAASSNPNAAQDTAIGRAAAGVMSVSNGGAIGSMLKVDALPTIASGFGTSPAVLTGSTPFAGRLTVGTGGVATTGTIDFNGTAFTSATYCVVGAAATNAAQRPSSTTTQLTFASTVAWTSGDVLTWICLGPK